MTSNLRQTIVPAFSLTAVVLFFQLTVVAPVRAQVSNGKADFNKYCSGCHGANGKGRGPDYVALGGTPPPDLTVLARNNGGVFPYKEVADIIDGTKTFPSHKRLDMPFWGVEFQNSSTIIPSKADKARVKARIDSLVDYIKTLQEP